MHAARNSSGAGPPRNMPARDRRITLSSPHPVNRPSSTSTAEDVAMIPTGHGQSGGT
jgi:hypothetical protein